MAEGGSRPLAVFPPPPPLWKHFTPENVEKLENIKAEATKSRGEHPKKKWLPSELQALDVPPELKYLIPPKAPTSGSYSVFGELQSLSGTLPSLKEQGIEQLYPSPPATDAGGEEAALTKDGRPLNHAYYLLKISKSLLLNFLEFVGILAVAPEQFEPKLEDIRNLFINAHHLLNLYRPHQARESLILMMEEQLERTRNEIQDMDKIKERVERLLEQLKTEGYEVQQPAAEVPSDRTENDKLDSKALQEARELWSLLKETDEQR